MHKKRQMGAVSDDAFNCPGSFPFRLRGGLSTSILFLALERHKCYRSKTQRSGKEGSENLGAGVSSSPEDSVKSEGLAGGSR